MFKIKIQANEFYAQQKPTTQDDNAGGVVGRWDLFLDEECYYQKAGSLAQHIDGNFGFIPHIPKGGFRFMFNAAEVEVKKY